MTGVAVRRRARISARVAGITGHTLVCSGQWELCLVMVPSGRYPRGRCVACLTGCRVASRRVIWRYCARVIRGVAGYAVHRSAGVPACVTRGTCNRLVCTGQRELCLVVVPVCGNPGRGRVT